MTVIINSGEFNSCKNNLKTESDTVQFVLLYSHAGVGVLAVALAAQAGVLMNHLMNDLRVETLQNKVC